jgi:putative transposase
MRRKGWSALTVGKAYVGFSATIQWSYCPGWAIDKTMTSSLVLRALIMANNLRRPPKGLVFHSDRESQYTSARYRKQLNRFGIRASMGGVGACWDNRHVNK